jgi:hypothetical protein
MIRDFTIWAIPIVACVQIASSQETPQAPQPTLPAAQVLGNDGTPMLLPFRCTDEDIRWSGLSCTEDSPCPMFLELSGVETLGNRVFLMGNIHGEAVTLYSVLLASDDNGHTWLEPHDRIRGAGLDHMESIGNDNAWVSGQVLFPLTHDPFLLTSTDGGKTWVPHEILSEDAESRYGAIQQFFFTSKDAGTLLLDRGAGGSGDRYARYETQNGGAAWSVKQESRQPIPLKRSTPAPASDWRVRPEGGMKSFLLEHRVGTRWSAVAAFLVKLDACKPPQ